ncbi:hypothetical protein Tco_0454982 [Tanacetum coccineum]
MLGTEIGTRALHVLMPENSLEDDKEHLPGSQVVLGNLFGVFKQGENNLAQDLGYVRDEFEQQEVSQDWMIQQKADGQKVLELKYGLETECACTK